MIPRYIKVLFVVPFAITICYFVYLCTVYSSVPEVIPIHSFGNNKDSYGNKIFLFLPIILNIIALMLIWRIIRRPDKIKFTFEIKEAEQEKIYHTTQLALVVFAIFISVMMGPLSFADVIFK